MASWGFSLVYLWTLSKYSLVYLWEHVLLGSPGPDHPSSSPPQMFQTSRRSQNTASPKRFSLESRNLTFLGQETLRLLEEKLARRGGGLGSLRMLPRFYWPPGLTLHNASCLLKLERAQKGSQGEGVGVDPRADLHGRVKRATGQWEGDKP